VDDSVESAGVVNIFAAAGIERPDVSILDDDFLQTFKDRPQANLRLKLLEKLMRDEIHLRARRNLAKARSFRDLLEKTLPRTDPGQFLPAPPTVIRSLDSPAKPLAKGERRGSVGARRKAWGARARDS
jgi:type I restriction enzyme R subunit